MSDFKIIKTLQIPDSMPTEFADAYNLYSDEQKDRILNTPKCNLSMEQLGFLFNPRPIGAYCESVYFLPEVLNYIFQNYNECAQNDDEMFEEFLMSFFSWITMYYGLLLEDNIWQNLDAALYELFCKRTSQYEIINSLEPVGANYVDWFFTQFNRNDTRLYEFPHKIVDNYIKKRFANPITYVDYAWLIFIYIGYLGARRGLMNACHSDILSEYQKDKSWHKNAVEVIIKETEKRPELSDYWTELLDFGMIF